MHHRTEPQQRLALYILAAAALILLGVLIGSAAHAQEPRTATITFTAPTQYVDGTAIAADTVITYNVYQGARGAQKAQVATITATATTINTGLQPGETCWQVAAVAHGVESELSDEGCKTFSWPATERVIITVQ